MIQLQTQRPSSTLQALLAACGLLLSLGLAGCAAGPQSQDAFSLERKQLSPLRYADSLVQGVFGLARVDNVDVEFPSLNDELRDDGVSTFPMVGGVWQTFLARKLLDVGVEAGFTAGWDSGSGRVFLGNGLLTVAGDIDLLGVDIFVGAVANLWLGDHLRAYVGAGPQMQYVGMDVDYRDANDERVSFSENGFGGGVYARAGFELLLRNHTLVGLGVRHVDSDVDLNGFGDVDFEATQVFLSVTRGF